MTVPLSLVLESFRPSRALALGGHRTVKFDQVATKNCIVVRAFQPRLRKSDSHYHTMVLSDGLYRKNLARGTEKFCQFCLNSRRAKTFCEQATC